MAPRRKRQRLSVDGAEAVTATVDSDPAPNVTEQPEKQKEDAIHKANLQQRRSLFVRSLAPEVTTDDLTELFSQSYPIKHAVAVLDPATKKCKGFGFVTFADAEDAQRAIEEFNKSDLKGKKIRVEVAEPRHRDVDTEIAGQKKSAPSAAATEAKAARQQKQREEQPQTKLIIRNLPWTIKEADQLALLFRSYGKVKHATLPKKNGKLGGFGFIVMRGRKNAEKALEGVNGKEVDGRTLAVDWAVEKDEWQNVQTAAEEEDKDEEMKDADETGSEDEEQNDDEDDLDDSDVDESDIDMDDEDGGIEFREQPPPRPDTSSSTLFIRNLPFSADDESLQEHFEQFGPVRYARIVLDRETERPKGTGFVCFVKEEDAIECLKGVPKVKQIQKSVKKESERMGPLTVQVTHSVLENEDADPTGRYTMDGRVLQISMAVNKDEATRLTAEGAASRFNRDKDKRRLYLLSEGTISSDSPLYAHLSPSEITLREASAKQRKALIQSNPSLHLSLTRLSVRNIPRSVTSKDLKQLARQAVVGFAKDVKEGKREKLSKEEIARGGQAMIDAEKERKKRGKGIVKQAKIVFETHEGSKVGEETGAGRSRGYGFIEYYTHRNALMGLRKLNGYAVDYKVKDTSKLGKKAAREAMEDRKKRLIVEFAIENANVVSRRSENEKKAKEGPKDKKGGKEDVDEEAEATNGNKSNKKRKRDSDATATKKGGKPQSNGASKADGEDGEKDDKLAKRSRIIQKKRMARRANKAGKA
ncbi:RNA-binding domain-containing protein [Delitschia confertaspora ATCC 74209]|uniref:RNA-binding domain-containing protein n=1 Tax=Delitschia confertaspora ATCC 74209 TaxID=1513339 RepID=A0A9P4JPZ5_9PLEO|nr:RNA-binding domain-containing protein [Delitschia confertaspora ATCC 74209]